MSPGLMCPWVALDLRIGKELKPKGRGQRAPTVLGISDQKLNFPFLVFHLGSERGRAMSAEVFVLIPIRQDQEKAFAHGNGLPATGTEELAGLKLVVRGLRVGG